MNSPTPHLRIQDLHFAYAQGPAVFNAWSADIAPGITVVCGDESVGKTTLLRLLAGDLRGQGHITLGGHALSAEAVFWQDPRAAPTDVVANDYLTDQAKRWPAWDTPAAQAHVDGLSLTEHLHKPMFALSTGGRRKVWLTAALASGAPLTLMDEAFAALDAASVRYLLTALQNTAHQQPDRCLLLAHWEPLPDLPEAALLHLP